MFPQTHVYFAEQVLSRRSDAITLGSIFPDMLVSAGVNHARAHSLGGELLDMFREDEELADFALGAVTHGISPQGLDYFGDEKYPGCQLGYCFEKGRPLVDQTIDACRLPPVMGLWKAHNIVEMGIEMIISSRGQYGQALRRAFNNDQLIERLISRLAAYTGDGGHLRTRIAAFPGYIEVYRATAESLAGKYRIQMFARHRINIDTGKVARLIEIAAGQVENDLADFFHLTQSHVRAELDKMFPPLSER
ncbi:MAG: hypothetical protein MJA84_10195 [Firmicutes bacterium]|nr:hypothetical protein [Bacillota bacterium]